LTFTSATPQIIPQTKQDIHCNESILFIRHSETRGKLAAYMGLWKEPTDKVFLYRTFIQNHYCHYNFEICSLQINTEVNTFSLKGHKRFFILPVSTYVLPQEA
jgi:hypothetical protein